MQVEQHPAQYLRPFTPPTVCTYCSPSGLIYPTPHEEPLFLADLAEVTCQKKPSLNPGTAPPLFVSSCNYSPTFYCHLNDMFFPHLSLYTQCLSGSLGSWRMRRRHLLRMNEE